MGAAYAENMIKRLFVFAFFIFSTQSAFAAKTKCDRRYVVSFLGMPPAYFVNKGEKSGSAYDVMMELMRRLGCKYSEQPESHSAARDGFLRNRTDVFGFTGPDPAMDQYGDYVEMVKLPRFLVINKKIYKPSDTIQSLIKNPKISFGGVIAGRYFYTEEEWSYLRKTQRLKEVPSPADIFNSLIAGRVQASFSVPIFTHFFLTRVKQRDKFVLIPDDQGTWTSLGFYLSHRRLSVFEREHLKKLIAEIRQDGTLEKIQQKYNDPVDLKYYQPFKPMALAWLPN